MNILIKNMEMPENGWKHIMLTSDGKAYRFEDGTADNTATRYEVVEVPCDYDELLKAARAMHTWIFLHSENENLAYKACGLSDEMNAFLGYSESLTLTVPGEDVQPVEWIPVTETWIRPSKKD